MPPRGGRAARMFLSMAARLRRLTQVVADIEAAGGSASALLADVTNEQAVNAAVEQIEKDGRPLELAIYNAGNNRPEKFFDVTAEVFEDMWKVICFGGFFDRAGNCAAHVGKATARHGKVYCLLVPAVLCAAKLAFRLLLPERALCV